MKNTFEAAYQQELKIRADYDVAEDARSEEGKEAARAAIHELWDSIDAKGQAYSRIYREYKDSRDKGNEYLDLHDVIWDKDVESLITCMRENGIERFTFSSGWSSAVESAWIFQQNGCRLQGLIELNSPNMNWFTGEREKLHGYLFSIQ